MKDYTVFIVHVPISEPDTFDYVLNRLDNVGIEYEVVTAEDQARNGTDL